MFSSTIQTMNNLTDFILSKLFFSHNSASLMNTTK